MHRETIEKNSGATKVLVGRKVGTGRPSQSDLATPLNQPECRSIGHTSTPHTPLVLPSLQYAAAQLVCSHFVQRLAFLICRIRSLIECTMRVRRVAKVLGHVQQGAESGRLGCFSWPFSLILDGSWDSNWRRCKILSQRLQLFFPIDLFREAADAIPGARRNKPGESTDSFLNGLATE
jgi:hypothetical protein